LAGNYTRVPALKRWAIFTLIIFSPSSASGFLRRVPGAFTLRPCLPMGTLYYGDRRNRFEAEVNYRNYID